MDMGGGPWFIVSVLLYRFSTATMDEPVEISIVIEIDHNLSAIRRMFDTDLLK